MSSYRGWLMDGLRAVINEVLDADAEKDTANDTVNTTDEKDSTKPQMSPTGADQRRRASSSAVQGFLGGIFGGKNSREVVDEIEKKRRQRMGLTEPLKEYVRHLCEHPETFIDFPLEEHLLKLKREQEEKERGPRGPRVTDITTVQQNLFADVSVGDQQSMSPEDAAVAAVTGVVPHSTQTEDAEVDRKVNVIHEEGDSVEENEESPPPPPRDSLTPEELERMLELSPKEQKHAMAMLEEVEELSLLRYDLCPLELSEEKFWRIYFLLVSNKLSSQFLKATDEHFHLSLTALGDAVTLENAFYLMMAKYLPREGVGNVSMFCKEGTAALETQFDDNAAGDEVLAWWHAHVEGFRVKETYRESFKHESHGKQGNVSKWDKLELKKLKEERSRVFKLLLRCGVPDDYRRQVWPLAPTRRVLDDDDDDEEQTLHPRHSGGKSQPRQRSRSALATVSRRRSSGAGSDRKADVARDEAFWNESATKFYQERLKSVFGGEAPLHCNPIPTFGGNIAFHQFHCISAGGVLAAKRILVVLALTFPNMCYAPALPDLIALLLLFLPEDVTYKVVETLVVESIERCHYLALGNRALTLFQLTFKHFLHRALPDLCATMAGLDVDLSLFFRDWISRLFVSYLPFQVVLRVMDCLLNEGSTVLFRVGLAILSLLENDLAACTSDESVRATLAARSMTFLDADALLNQAWAFKGVTRRTLVRKYMSIIESGQMDVVPNGSMTIFTSPIVRTPSGILSSDQFESLWSWVPARYQLQELERVFTTENDGFNLSLLIQSSRGQLPTVILIETIDGQTFGAFIGNEWKLTRSEKEFYGSGENFLFTLVPKEAKYAWKSGQPEQHMMLTENALVLGGSGSGGSGSGLRLDSELWHGLSHNCDTYANSPLHVGGNEFECKAVELYSIVQ